MSNMTNMTRLLERNEQFTRTYTSAALGLPTAQVVVVACLDHRVDPAIVLGLSSERLPSSATWGAASPRPLSTTSPSSPSSSTSCPAPGAPLTQSSKSRSSTTPNAAPGSLADPSFRQLTAAATGLPEAALEASAVADPHTTVKADVERLLASPLLSPRVSVSGHVYDIASGRVTTTVDARYP